MFFQRSHELCTETSEKHVQIIKESVLTVRLPLNTFCQDLKRDEIDESEDNNDKAILESPAGMSSNNFNTDQMSNETQNQINIADSTASENAVQNKDDSFERYENEFRDDADKLNSRYDNGEKRSLSNPIGSNQGDNETEEQENTTCSHAREHTVGETQLSSYNSQNEEKHENITSPGAVKGTDRTDAFDASNDQEEESTESKNTCENVGNQTTVKCFEYICC